MWQLRCIATRGGSTPRQPFSALIKTPIGLPSLKSVNLSVPDFQRFSADNLRYVVTWTFDSLSLGVRNVSNCVATSSENKQSAADTLAM